MSITNSFRIKISPLRLHSASSVQISHSTSSFRSVMPPVMIRPLDLFFAASVNFNGAGNTNMFNKNIRVRLSPIKPHILRNIQIRSNGVECILVFLNAVLRGVDVVNI